MVRPRDIYLTIGLFAGLVAAHAAAAEDGCGLCNTAVVLDRPLATCFLQQFPELSQADEATVTVDLKSCAEESRGVFEAFPQPNGARLKPDIQFMVTREQLTCLKRKLEDEDLSLDPAARIELAGC